MNPFYKVFLFLVFSCLGMISGILAGGLFFFVPVWLWIYPRPMELTDIVNILRVTGIIGLVWGAIAAYNSIQEDNI